LHVACLADNVTNLDFLDLLLEEGADPNDQDYLGRTPLMVTTKLAPIAAKFLLYWLTTDANPSWTGFVLMSSIFPTQFYSLKPLTGCSTDSCFSSGVASRRSWWKEEPMIPVSHPLSSWHRLGILAHQFGHFRVCEFEVDTRSTLKDRLPVPYRYDSRQSRNAISHYGIISR
jgi:hypothetical protein